MLIVLVKLFLVAFPVIANNSSDEFELSVIHLNDFHARYEEMSPSTSACKNSDCIGGFSRIYTSINNLAKENPNSIILNAGDNFQGTLWYNTYKWNVTQYFLNLIQFDAFTLGNHEFDDGIEGIVPYMKSLNAPIVVANIDDANEPNFQKLYNKSVVLERDERRIGVIGVTTRDTLVIRHLSHPGKLEFLDEIDSVNKEAERLVDEEHVDTVIVLSHCGYELDKKLAETAAPKIGLIVGGHSHTFLYTGEHLPGPDFPKGPYPTVIKHEDGRKILIVQAGALSKYVGHIKVKYDSSGNVTSWTGMPVYLDKKVPQDKIINEKLATWKNSLSEQQSKILGQTKVTLSNSNCRYSECNFGNFITDAMVYSYLNYNENEEIEKDSWTYASVAVLNSAGIKTSIEKGNITFNDLTLTLPFRNTFSAGEIKGKHLKDVLEYAGGYEKHYYNKYNMNLLQVSGLKIVYNVTEPFGSRVQSVKVLCRKCPVPLYQDLDLEKDYRIVINTFLASGGEGHKILQENFRNEKIGRMDIDVLGEYIEKHTPITQGLDNRMTIVH